jgi:hypothetical protein
MGGPVSSLVRPLEIYRRTAGVADIMLKGKKPADLL